MLWQEKDNSPSKDQGPVWDPTRTEMPPRNKGWIVLLSGDNVVFSRLPASKFYLSSSRLSLVLCLAAERKDRKSRFYELSGREQETNFKDYLLVYLFIYFCPQQYLFLSSLIV